MKNMALVGIADDEKAKIGALLQQASSQLGLPWGIGDNGTVDFVIVDLAQFSGRVARIRAQDERKPFAVVADVGADTLGATLVLRRPLSQQGFVELLNSVFGAVVANVEPPPADDFRSRETTNATAAPASFENVSRERICTDIDKLLPRNGAVLIERPGLAALVLDASTDSFYSSAQLSDLEPYFRDVIKSGEVRPIGGARLAAFRASATAHPLARLRWLGALLRSNGWLASHLDPGGTYQVKSWISMDGDYRRQYRIATAMLRPAPLHRIAATAKVTMAEVFDVVNAYDAIGLLEWTPRRSRYAAPEVALPAKRDERALRAPMHKHMQRLLAATAFPR